MAENLILKKEYRDILAGNQRLRSKIGIDIGANERTIQKWAVGISPKLVTEAFLNALKKHLGAKGKVSDLTEAVNLENHTHLHEA